MIWVTSSGDIFFEITCSNTDSDMCVRERVCIPSCSPFFNISANIGHARILRYYFQRNRATGMPFLAQIKYHRIFLLHQSNWGESSNHFYRQQLFFNHLWMDFHLSHSIRILYLLSTVFQSRAADVSQVVCSKLRLEPVATTGLSLRDISRSQCDEGSVSLPPNNVLHVYGSSDRHYARYALRW